MRKLFLHVGFAKCGSTSLQHALTKAPGIFYPKSGNNAGEHLSLPLFIRGVDEWTRQFFDEAWVAENHKALMEEIASSTGDVALSSERLAAMTLDEISCLPLLFPKFEIHILFVKRSVEKYLKSTWRHAGTRHDVAEDYDTFFERTKNFSLGDAQKKFSPLFPVHTFDMDSPDYSQNIGKLLSTTIELPQSNVGVPFQFAQFLQKTHVLLGSRRFKEIYDPQTKREMLAVELGQATMEIDKFNVNLF